MGGWGEGQAFSPHPLPSSHSVRCLRAQILAEVPVDPKQGALEGLVPLGRTENKVRGVESPGLARRLAQWHHQSTRGRGHCCHRAQVPAS